MQDAIRRKQLLGQSSKVDEFSIRLVQQLLSGAGEGSQAGVKFLPVTNESACFVVLVHCKRVRFDFVHAIHDGPHGDILVGRFNVYVEDRKSDLHARKGGFTLFPPTDIAFDDGGTTYFGIEPMEYDIQSARDQVKRIAVSIAQDELQRLPLTR